MTPIHWLVQSMDDCPGLNDGVAPEGLLCAREQARLDELTVLKRRRDWMLGRWTSKRLLQSVLAAEGEPPLPLASMLIGNDPDGAPYAAWAGLGTDAGEPQRMPVSLSISHSNGVALCAVADLQQMAGVTVGADLERVEPREPPFVSDFFAADEIALIRSVEGDRAEYDRMVTAIWSAKEAVLKALREGLRIDTRAVICLIQPPLSVRDDWTPLTIHFGERLAHLAVQRSTFSGWWRRLAVHPKFMMTMVVQQEIED